MDDASFSPLPFARILPTLLTDRETRNQLHRLCRVRAPPTKMTVRGKRVVVGDERRKVKIGTCSLRKWKLLVLVPVQRARLIVGTIVTFAERATFITRAEITVQEFNARLLAARRPPLAAVCRRKSRDDEVFGLSIADCDLGRGY